MTFKWSDLDQSGVGFHRFKVRVKPEIVSFGVEDLDLQQTGEHVGAERWNELLDDPDVLVIDTATTTKLISAPLIMPFRQILTIFVSFHSG